MANATRTRPRPAAAPDSNADPQASAAPESEQESRPVTAVPSLDDLMDAPGSLAELSREPNPYQNVTKRDDVLDAKIPKMLPVTDEDQAKMVTKYLRRDATENGLGLSVRTVTKDGNMFVVFRSKSTKRQITATSDEIRAWALENGLPTEVGLVDGKGKNAGKKVKSVAIPKSTRDAYRDAHPRS